MQKHFISTLHLWQWHAWRTLPSRPVELRGSTPRHGTRSKTISVSLRATAIFNFKPLNTNTMNPYGFLYTPQLQALPYRNLHSHIYYIFDLNPLLPNPVTTTIYDLSVKKTPLTNTWRSPTEYAPQSHATKTLSPLTSFKDVHCRWWFKSAWGCTTVSRCHKTSLTNQLLPTYGFYYLSSNLKKRDLTACSIDVLQSPVQFDMFDHFGIFPPYIICHKYQMHYTVTANISYVCRNVQDII